MDANTVVTYQDNPMYQIMEKAGLVGKTCEEVYGNDKVKLAECQQMMKSQKRVNDGLSKINSVASNFDSLLNVPEKILQERPEQKAIAQEIKERQKKAFYQDITDVYGIHMQKENMENSDDLGLSKRITDFTDALKKRNQGIENRVHSQLQTLNHLQKTQNWNQNIISDYQDKLNHLKNHLHTKKRLIEINEDAAQTKKRAIGTIIATSGSFVVAFVALILYLAKTISLKTFLYVILGTAIFVFVYLFFIGDQPNKNYTKIIKKLDSGITKTGDHLNLSALQWVDKNCDCPVKAKKISTKHVKPYGNGNSDSSSSSSYQKLVNHLEGDQEDGIWMSSDDDHTTQKITPFAFQKGTGKNLKSLQEGDDADIDLNDPDVKKAQETIKKQSHIIQNISSIE
jgi:uncharacterized coiled-coil protein SlyX